MARQLKAALLCAVIAVLFVALEIVFDIQTAIAGVFVMGVGGGLLISDQIAKEPPAGLVD